MTRRLFILGAWALYDVANSTYIVIVPSLLFAVYFTAVVQAFQNFLAQAISALQANQTATAINKVQDAIARTDGCVLRGAPDGAGNGRDWVTNCQAQAQIYGALTTALGALTP